MPGPSGDPRSVCRDPPGTRGRYAGAKRGPEVAMPGPASDAETSCAQGRECMCAFVYVYMYVCMCDTICPTWQQRCDKFICMYVYLCLLRGVFLFLILKIKIITLCMRALML
jgi:hypothetical protein